MRFLRRLHALCRSQSTFAFSLGSAAFGLLSAVVAAWRESGWGLVGAAVVLLVAAIGLLVTWRDATKLGASLYQIDAATTEQADRYENPYQDWMRLEVGETSVIYSPALNQRLASDDPIAVTVSKQRWQPEGHHGDLATAWATRGGFNNESKLRLNTDLLAATRQVHVQKTDYAAYIATNNLAKREIWRGQRRELEVKSVATRHDTGEIRRLAGSLCSNHLGGDVLAVSPGRAYLQVQGDTEVSARMRVASGSGSLDFGDTRGASTLNDIVKQGLRRELREELGLRAWRGEVPTLSDIRIIGYSRATYMAGKPQFYAVSRLERDVRPRRSWRERRWLSGFGEPLEFDPLRGAEGLMAALRELQRAYGANFSDSLTMLLEMIELWFESDPNAEDWLFRDLPDREVDREV